MRHIIYLLLSSDVLWSVDDSFFPCCPLFLAEWQQKQQQRLPHARAIVGRWGGSSYRQRQHACWVLKEMNRLTAALMSPSFPLFPLFLFFFFHKGVSDWALNGANCPLQRWRCFCRACLQVPPGQFLTRCVSFPAQQLGTGRVSWIIQFTCPLSFMIKFRMINKSIHLPCHLGCKSPCFPFPVSITSWRFWEQKDWKHKLLTFLGRRAPQIHPQSALSS